MLYVSLVLSAILLLLANVAAFHPKRPMTAFFVCGVLFTAAPCGLGLFFLPPVGLLFLFLGTTLLLWQALSRKPRVFLPLSLLATVLAYAYPVYSALQDSREFARLRERFPNESLEGRLPVPGDSLRQAHLSHQAEEQLRRLEESTPDQGGSGRWWPLRQLHEDKVRLFINSPGFGVARMSPPTETRLSYGLRPENPVPQPTYYVASPPAAVKPVTPGAQERDALARLHESGVVDFVYPEGFGLFRDRRNVAGFRPHQFSAVPDPVESWEVRRLDLIGLLLHDAPVAYVTDDLPRMEVLRSAPTRPLDGFEAAALEELRKGEDLLVSGPAGELRMLGAVRSTKQCRNCHGGERGDLLGAFSYLLRRGDSPKK
jgi:hypothetical protein